MRKEILAEILNRTGRRSEDAEEHLKRCRLSSAIRAEETQNLAIRERDADIVYGGDALERLREIARDHSVRHSTYLTGPNEETVLNKKQRRYTGSAR